MKKLFTLITALLVILSFFTTAAFAYGEESPSDEAAENRSATEGRDALLSPDGEESDSADTNEAARSEGDANSPSEESLLGADADVDTESEDTPEADEGKAEGSWAEEAYGLILENADKLLALLACISSLLVGFAYKKGLLPLLRNGLTALGSAVSSLKERSEKAEELAESAIGEAADKLARAEDCFKVISDRLATLEKELDLARESSLKDVELRLILNSQIDMLYELLMSSSLPSYQKDSIGESVAKMKRALASGTESK